MLVRFWGVRGSIPTPITSDEIKKKILWVIKQALGQDLGSDRQLEEFVDDLPKHMVGTYGGNTPCVELESGDTTIVFDAGSGIRGLGIRLMEGRFGKGAGTCHLFLSHTHWDHIQGLPFFLPAYVSGNKVVIYSPDPDIRQSLSAQQDPRYFPVPLEAMEADIDFVLLSEGKKTLIDDIEVSNIKLNHPGGAFGYRAQKGDAALVYATDIEVANIDSPEMKKYINFFSGAKILVFDSQYTLVEAFEKEDWGHSSSLKGVDIMTEAGVDTLVLFHHEPTYDDRTLWDIFQRTSKYAKLQGVNSASRVIMAYEGLELTI